MLKFILALLLTTVNGLQYSGADLSSLTVTQRTATLKDNSGATIPNVMTWVKNQGVNIVRLRLWVNPTSPTDYGYAYTLALAQQAQAAGMAIYLDFHYSDTWADPGHQATSPSWSSYNTIALLKGQVYTYTKTTLNNFKAAGVTNIAIVSIGNEINNGMMWPLGVLSNPKNIAYLLHSAAWGVKDSNISPTPSIAIHLADGWKWSGIQSFMTSVLAYPTDTSALVSTDYDMIAVSYYPMYNTGATLAALKSSLINIGSTYAKKVIIAETNWPFSCTNSGAPTFPSDLTSVPFSSAGQTTFMVTDLKAAVKGIGSSRGVGVFYWEPTWVQNQGLGTPCLDELFFDPSTDNARNNWSNVFAALATP